jgi:putative ABC transport system permease protein
MDLHSILQMALRALGRNKLRAVLSIVGITIGIGAVICTVALGEGGSQQIQEQLLSMGDNAVWIEAGGRNVNGVRSGTRGTKTLLLSDAQAIEQSIPLIKLVSPHVDNSVQIVYGNQNWYTQYRGVSPEYLRIRRWMISSGLPFTRKDVEDLSNVCLIGQTVIERLFGNEDPVGKTIRVKTLPFTVIGTLQSKGLSTFGNDQDDVIMMPYTTAMHKVKGIDWLDDILTSAISPEAVRPARDQIIRLLRQRHRLRPDEPDDFNIRSPEEIVQAQEEASRTFTLMLASIASVSLLVGGIGIMNIMLVSVTERTREIGVRMAVGATQRNVQMQFLSEALMLSLFGGAIGVVVGLLGAYCLSAFLEWPTSVPAVAVVIAAAFSVAVGIFFGYYPALKASQLDPIEALRYE